MKILYITDTHDMGRNPGARIDDYHEAIMEKFKEAVNVAIKENVSAFVHGGDWFHTPKVANTIYNQHQRLLRRLRKKKIPVYVVPGNHDLYGYTIDTLDQTSIGSFAHAGLVRILKRDKSVLLDDNNIAIAFHGREYSIDIDNDAQVDYDIKPNINADVNILFSHGMLLDKPFHPDVRFTLTKDVYTQADYVFNGHYHPGWKAHEINGTWFYNNGSTGRDEGSIDSVKRTPQYTLIDIHFDKASGQVISNIQAQPYKCAKKGEDVFDRTQLVEKKQHVRHLESFKQTIQDALAFEKFNPKDILLNTKGLNKSLLQEAIDRITKEEKRIHDGKLDGFVPKKRVIGIASVEMINFQSHKKTKVVFNEKGLNAITGPSDSGKSAAIRAIRWALYNDPKGSEFIRNGATRTTVTVTFTDHSAITRSRTRSSAGEYIVRDTTGKETEFKGFGSNLPIDIVNTHQMPKVELAAGIERSLNFSNQLDGHFLLSESPAVRASTLGRITGVHIVDASIREVSKDIRNITIDTNAGEKRIAEIDEELSGFADLDDQKDKLNIVHGLMQLADAAERKILSFSELLEVYEVETDRSRDYYNQLKDYADVQKGELAIQVAENNLKEIDRLATLLDDVYTYGKQAKRLEADVKQYQGIDTGLQKIEEAKTLDETIYQLDALYEDYVRYDDQFKEYKDDLFPYKNLANMPDLQDIEKVSQGIVYLQDLQKEYIKHDEAVELLEKDLLVAATKVGDIELRIQELILEIGTCPTCHQTMDTHVADNILKHTH